MSQYANLDAMIIEAVGPDEAGAALYMLRRGEVRREVARLAENTGREAMRVLDGRLQALRKAGKLRYDTKRGWLLAETAEAP